MNIKLKPFVLLASTLISSLALAQQTTPQTAPLTPPPQPTAPSQPAPQTPAPQAPTQSAQTPQIPGQTPQQQTAGQSPIAQSPLSLDQANQELNFELNSVYVLAVAMRNSGCPAYQKTLDTYNQVQQLVNMYLAKCDKPPIDCRQEATKDVEKVRKIAFQALSGCISTQYPAPQFQQQPFQKAYQPTFGQQPLQGQTGLSYPSNTQTTTGTK